MFEAFHLSLKYHSSYIPGKPIVIGRLVLLIIICALVIVHNVSN